MGTVGPRNQSGHEDELGRDGSRTGHQGGGEAGAEGGAPRRAEEVPRGGNRPAPPRATRSRDRRSAERARCDEGTGENHAMTMVRSTPDLSGVDTPDPL